MDSLYKYTKGLLKISRMFHQAYLIPTTGVHDVVGDVLKKFCSTCLRYINEMFHLYNGTLYKLDSKETIFMVF